ncbi:MAG TPA: methyltransferase domain-containing protein [Ktedonobacterales bacterium]
MPAEPPPARSATNARRLAALRRRAGARCPPRDLALAIPGLPETLPIALPADPEAALDELAARQRRSAPLEHAPLPATTAAEEARGAIAAGTHMPYWALLWPSGLALAEALAAAPESVRGRRVLELGCGLGVTAAVALRLGARLWAADCFAEALLYCQYNALRCAGRLPRSVLVDWRTARGRRVCQRLAPFDLVLAADVLYEPEDIAPLLALLPTLLAPGGAGWLAEPGRHASKSFVAAAARAGWHDQPTIYDRTWPPDGKPARVTLHRYTRLAST